jgi:predicted ABC-type ATPase
MSAKPPHVIVIAGPNGAGKSTTAPELISGLVKFQNYVNPDLIARGLAPLDPSAVSMTASRIVLQRLDELAGRHDDFAFETTLSGRTYARRLFNWKQAGYKASMIYYWLESEELAVARVAERVRSGGHNIPELDIRRRYHAGLRNFFKLYTPLLCTWRFFNNSGNVGPVLLAKYEGGHECVNNPQLWSLLKHTYM